MERGTLIGVTQSELQELQDAKRQRDILLATTAALMAEHDIENVHYSHQHLEGFSGRHMNIQGDERGVMISMEAL